MHASVALPFGPTCWLLCATSCCCLVVLLLLLMLLHPLLNHCSLRCHSLQVAHDRLLRQLAEDEAAATAQQLELGMSRASLETTAEARTSSLQTSEPNLLRCVFMGLVTQ